MRLAYCFLAVGVVLAGCGGSSSSSGGVQCGDRRCDTGQVCCLDCNGQGTCGAPGLPCPGVACQADGGADDAGMGVTCGATTCTTAQVCCLDCHGIGTCGAPGVECTGEGCGTCDPPCGDGTICCSEPSHMQDDAGNPGFYLVCAPPEEDGSCPLYP